MRLTQHIHYHVPVKVCERCGYMSPSPYYDPIGMHEHIIHTVQDSDKLLERLLKPKKAKK